MKLEYEYMNNNNIKEYTKIYIIYRSSFFHYRSIYKSY